VDITTFASDSPAGKILDNLQRQGEATIKELEDVLGISTTAVREHLTNLQARGLLETSLIRRGPGRPALVYALSHQGRSLVPKSYDTLISLLMQEIASREGEAQLQVLLDAVGARMARDLQGKVNGEDLHVRLGELRAALEQRGIPAAVEPASDGFKVFACPYHELAQEHAGVCTMERRMLEQLLGERLQLDGTIREGHRSCHFRVGPATISDVALVEGHEWPAAAGEGAGSAA
jgi:predicted ArsR family transcriptional regulator